MNDITQAILQIAETNKPSSHEFFTNLKNLNTKIISNEKLLGEFYLHYQAAMHATRVMVYFLPFLNSPDLRIRKLEIFVDDDGLPNGDTHHYQLSRAFQRLGAKITLKDDDFGELSEIKKFVDSDISKFIDVVTKLYPKSLGAWCIAELVSTDWLHAMCDALSVHFPQMKNDPYFKDCFDNLVEEKHGAEALSLTKDIVKKYPELLNDTVEHAKKMANALNLIWDSLNKLIKK